jgi:hypothetical protein
MTKYATLFMRLNKVEESRIYVVDDFALDVVGQGDLAYRHGKISDVYHVPNLSANMFSISQLTQTGKIVEFWPDRFYVWDLKKGKSIVIDGVLDPTDNLYKFCDSTQPKYELISLISHTYERS